MGGVDQTALIDGGLGAIAYAESVTTYIAFTLSRIANYSTTLCSWHSGIKYETVTSTFGVKLLPMVWDFAEANPFSSMLPGIFAMALTGSPGASKSRRLAMPLQ